VGKTSIAAQFVDKTFSDAYVTTIANEKKCTHTVCGKTFEIQL